MSHLWQHPYVNVFKHYNIQTWKKCSKEGEVSVVMDRTLKSTVYRITGSIPAGNYIQLPKTSSQSLGLTGRYVYFLFKPIASKYFVIHIDVATQDGLIIRISFSNLFKEFKSTSTWLQFPFICHSSKSSLSGVSGLNSREFSGAAPINTRWTVLCLNFNEILSVYLNRHFSYLKSIKLCANLIVKNIFTSDILYKPGVTLDEVKRSGVSTSTAPMPREMAFPLSKMENWEDIYDHIHFPGDGPNKPFDSMQFTDDKDLTKTNTKTVYCSKPEKPATIDNLTRLSRVTKKHTVTTELPSVGVDDDGSILIQQNSDDNVHVYAAPGERIVIMQENKKTSKDPASNPTLPEDLSMKKSYKCLKPDPILQLKRIIGFGGASSRHVLWNNTGTILIYPCHAVVVAMQASNGHQRFFVGHTEKVSCIAINDSSSLLASGQTGQQSVVRIWKFQTSECLAMFKTHAHSLSCLSMSSNGGTLAGVGKDSHNKNMVVIWNLDQVQQSGQARLVAKAHTDVDISKMTIASFDDTRMVSCGRDNIRLWRVKNGALRSAPVNLGEYHSMDFTDCCFEAGYHPMKDPTDRTVYACSKSGHIFEVDYKKVTVSHVRKLHAVVKNGRGGKNESVVSNAGIALNCMCVSEAFCVTGSDDGYIRLWPLDFKQVYLEAEHEGPVTAIDISSDGLRLLAGTCMGNIGVLDLSTRGYTTVMRSHTGRILSVSFDSTNKHMATVADDHTIRVWELDTMQQLYDFTAPKECPCSIAYHPRLQIFACGFESGIIRIFNVIATSMIAEQRHHNGKIIGLAFSPNADYLYSAGSLGSLALHDADDTQYRLLRLLGNTVARGDLQAPDALTVSPDGQRVAFVGPTNFTISVVDGRSLDELMRIDISSLNAMEGNPSTSIDNAVKVKYTPESVDQLLVTTSNNRLLKFDAKNGRILAQIDNIHRCGCTSVDISRDGHYLATAGDKVIKVWDYLMRLDLNFQVFIGHSESISRILFSPDMAWFMSFGEAIFVWDFFGGTRRGKPQATEGRTKVMNYYSGNEEDLKFYDDQNSRRITDEPRKAAPKPITPYQLGEQIENLSIIDREPIEELLGEEILSEMISDEEQEHAEDVIHIQKRTNVNQDDDVIISRPSDGNKPDIQFVPMSPSTSPFRGKLASTIRDNPVTDVVKMHSKPSVNKHFSQRAKGCNLAQRRYAAAPSQAGLHLKTIIGYNGNGRGNMVWNSETGLFAYTTGCVVIVEDLSAGSQRHLLGHNEEISTLAMQHDCQCLASASGSLGLSAGQIFIWDLQEYVCKRTLSYHEFDVVALSYARDDRFLISLGDYRECSVVIWSTYTYTVLTCTKTSVPMHDVKWDPYTVNEFVSVGENGTVLFWLLDETRSDPSLSVHEAEVPPDLISTHHMGAEPVSFTSIEYGDDSTVFIATNTGKVSAWDTRKNSCFMHWEADTHEIDCLVSHRGRLITGSTGRSLRLWSIVGIGEMKLPGELNMMRSQGLTMEDEMNLDGAITAAAFDDTLDMGIVGTTAGTLWYINWTERMSIRLVSGHGSKINALELFDEEYLITCTDDGSIRIWSLTNKEQTLQFQVLNQSCNCIALAPSTSSSPINTVVSNLDRVPVVAHTPKVERPSLPKLVAGYSDGTVRMFDLNRVEMVLKMHPHAVPVTAVSFSSDGRMILSGGSDGLVAVSSPTTGMTVRMINDHQGAPITCFDVTLLQSEDDKEVSSPQLWLAASADRRVSVWSADWSKDFCELIDWLTFPAPAFIPQGTITKSGQTNYHNLPPCIAKFSIEEVDTIVYTGFGMQKQLQFYSLAQKKVLRTSSLTHWAHALDLSTSLIAVGTGERLLKLIDYYEGSFQDFIGHDDSVSIVKFSPKGRLLISASHSEVFLWTINV